MTNYILILKFIFEFLYFSFTFDQIRQKRYIPDQLLEKYNENYLHAHFIYILLNCRIIIS